MKKIYITTILISFGGGFIIGWICRLLGVPILYGVIMASAIGCIIGYSMYNNYTKKCISK